jgi:pimeloyl-ACP methyl ester carboxylesterase
LAVCFAVVLPGDAAPRDTDTVDIRGHAQFLHLYGTRGAPPVVVSSGDGGWIHLAPQVAEVLAAKGFFVVGFDAKAYLESFTSGTATVRPEDEPGDYKVLADYAARGATQRPILIGVSEGAGLSVLAATDPRTKHAIAGVICLGLPNLNELGWRWRDSLIYLTHGVPNEPTFKSEAIVGRVSPTPIAAIHSTHDEFVPLTEVQRVLEAAHEPKRLWVVPASNHRFSDNPAEFDQRLIDAIAWIRGHAVQEGD